MVQRLYDSVSLEVYAGWVKEIPVHMQFGFTEVAYTFRHMIFEVVVGYDCWCSVLGSALCSGDSDLTVQIYWLLIDVVVFNDCIIAVIDFWALMLLLGSIWKFDETWPTYGVIVYQEYQV